MNFKRIVHGLLYLGIFLSSPLLAEETTDQDETCYQNEKPMNGQQYKDWNYENTYQTPDIPDSVAEKIYPSSARVKPAGKGEEETSGFLDGTFLYWHVSQDDMELARETGGTNPSVVAKIFDFDNKYHPAFRIETGFYLPHDGWELDAAYTWVYFDKWSHYRNNSFDSTYQEAISNWTFPVFEVDDASWYYVRAKWDFSFNLIRLALGRNYHTGNMLRAKPFFGLAVNVIDQKYHWYFLSDDTSAPGHDNVYSFSEMDSWAIGPYGGVDLSWNLYEGLDICTFLATTLPYTHFKVSYRSNYPTTNLAGEATFKHKVQLFCPSLEARLGLSYGGYIANDNYHLKIAALYEFNLFLRQNAMRAYLEEVAINQGSALPGDLRMHGISISLKFDF